MPASVPAPVPVTSGPSAVQKFIQDKDWKFYAAVASVSLIAGAGLYYLTKPSSEAEEPKSTKSKSKKKKNKKKTANKDAASASSPEAKGNNTKKKKRPASRVLRNQQPCGTLGSDRRGEQPRTTTSNGILLSEDGTRLLQIKRTFS